MKIRRTKITASANVANPSIPEMFEKYYEIASDDVVSDMTGYYPESGQEYPCEHVDGYDVKHIAWAVAKDEYEGPLGNHGLDIVEVVSESGGDPQLAYSSGDRIYPVTISEIETVLDGYDDLEGSVDMMGAECKFNRGDRVGVYFGIYSGKEGTIIDCCPSDVVSDPVPGENYYYVLLDGPGYEDDYMIFGEDDMEPLQASESIEGAIDTGLEYWYFTRHGLGPGMMPQGVNILDTYEEGFKTWFKVDKLLTTEELNYYDIQESWPPEGAVTNHGEVIEGCDDVDIQADDRTYYGPGAGARNASAFYKGYKIICDRANKLWTVADKYDNAIEEGFANKQDAYNYVNEITSSTYTEGEGIEASTSYNGLNRGPEYNGTLERFQNYYYGDYADSYDEKTPLNGMCWCVGYSDDEEGYNWRSFTNESWEQVKNLSNEDIYNMFPVAPEVSYDDVEGSTTCKKVSEDDNSINYVVSSEDVEGSSLINYKNYRIFCDPTQGGWEVLTRDHDLIKSGFGTESAAKSYIDTELANDIHGSKDVEDGDFDASSEQESSSAETDINGSSTYAGSIDLDYLENEIREGCEKYLTGPEGGFLPSGSEKESRYDMTADEVYTVEVADEGDRIRVEVRAELDYEGMENLSEVLDPIVQKYNSDAYFDMVTSGIMEAYIYDPESTIESSTDINADADFDKALAEHEKSYLEPSYVDGDEVPEDLIVDFDFDFAVNVEEDGDWAPVEGQDPLFHAEDYSEKGLDAEKLEDDFSELLLWHIPDRAGKYGVKGKAHLEYYYHDDRPVFDARRSAIRDYEYVNLGKADDIESSTEIKASMTEEELDNAILEGKPFELSDFKKYKVPGTPNVLKGRDIELGDVIEITEDASEVNLGTIVKILAINDPAERWIDFTFKCEIVEDPGQQSLSVGDVIDLHFDADEEIGIVVPF